MTKRSAARAMTTAETPRATAGAASAEGAVCRPSLEDDRSIELVKVAKALSDPIRVRMLEMMSQGRSCCGLTAPADRGVPGTDEPRGICVCEFQERFGLGQSKTSYHLRVLKDAGLVTEETRGKWSFYAIDHSRVERSLTVLRGLLGP